MKFELDGERTRSSVSVYQSFKMLNPG